MTDNDIIELFFDRDEQAIVQTDRRHGSYCRAISRRILSSAEDAEECVSDSYLRLWQRIPPERPALLQPYLGRIVRNLSLDRLRELGAEKRGGRALTVALDELRSVCSPEDAESLVAARELGAAIDRFLRTLPEEHANVFLRRYYFFDSRSEIAARYGITSAQVSVKLSRVRKKLAQYLKEEGYL